MQKEIKMQVTEELSVRLLPTEQHEFLMSTKEVAVGYGTTEYVIRVSKMRHESELIEGKHFLIAANFEPVTKCYGTLKLPPNSILWTKRGIIRLGFFIKSERAKLFRDWAEELIINVLEAGENFLQPVPVIQQRKPRNHNRLTQDRMIAILSDVAKIDDRELRLSLISKLGV